jgi:hypothetical protein
MERVATLIGKLQEQHLQNADNHIILMTAQLLVAELQSVPSNSTNNISKISVVMPSGSNASRQITQEWAQETMVLEEVAHQPITKLVQENPAIKEEKGTWLFDPIINSIPTLVHQEGVGLKEVFELNDTMVAEGESFNEFLKEDKREVATALQEAPVRDLRKAIGINERYRFTRELFRDDENMYERSIKTINAFNIYAEAEYWIQRELKVKLGWEDGNDTVADFDQLVRRRFL